MTEYTYEEHQHNFASWAAARAAQRKFKGATVGVLKMALEYVGLPKYVQSPQVHHRSEEAFDKQHREWCHGVIEFLQPQIENPTYGLAAKLINVYLKSTVVLGRQFDSELAAIVHPPIDNLLLKGIAQDKSLPNSLRKRCETAKWTQFSEADYRGLIFELRRNKLHKPHFWALERYWPVSNE